MFVEVKQSDAGPVMLFVPVDLLLLVDLLLHLRIPVVFMYMQLGIKVRSLV